MRALLLILKEVVRALLGVGRIQRLVQELLLSALIACEAARLLVNQNLLLIAELDRCGSNDCSQLPCLLSLVACSRICVHMHVRLLLVSSRIDNFSSSGGMGRRRHALAHPHLLIHEVKILRSRLLAVRILRRGDRLQVFALLLLTPLTRSSQGVTGLGAIG